MSMSSRSLVWAALAPLLACTGDITPEGPQPSAPAAAPHQPGSVGTNPTTNPGTNPSAPLPSGAVAGEKVFRRLTLAQYKSTVRALLGDARISPDLREVQIPTELDAFSNLAAGVMGYERGQAMAIHDTAAASTDAVFSDSTKRMTLVGCRPGSAGDTCVRDFIRAFGRRAFRRPLTDAELTRYMGVVSTATAELGNDAWSGLRYAVAAFLQSPKLLYFDEAGEPDPTVRGRYRYTSWEMATRLAYALTDGPPDNDLLTAAERGTLTDTRLVQAEAERLLSVAAPHQGLGTFLTQHLHVDSVGSLGKDARAFPTWTPSLAASLEGEIDRLLGAAVAGTGGWSDLLTSRKTFLNEELARFYGLPPLGRSGFVEVMLPADGPRVGVLGTGAFLASQARFSHTSPTLRGKFVMERLLCRSVPPPPPDADSELPPASSTIRTVRQRLERHRTNPACAGCHALMDPAGLMMERFDGIGQYRTTENGEAIDESGEIDGVTVSGLAGIAETVAAKRDAVSCVSRQMFRFLAGYEEGARMVTEVESIGAAVQGKMKPLALKLVTSDLFRTFAPGGQP